ncbi:hypothetical protein GALMADRAFT_1035669, partial [Galerina marginata CBS 339.88]
MSLLFAPWCCPLCTTVLLVTPFNLKGQLLALQMGVGMTGSIDGMLSQHFPTQKVSARLFHPFDNNIITSLPTTSPNLSYKYSRMTISLICLHVDENADQKLILYSICV